MDNFLYKKRYHAQVEQVHSGDDMVLFVDLGIDGLFKRVRARLAGVDTPDAFKARSDSEAGKIRDSVRKITLNRPCFIEVESVGKGGWVVTLYLRDGDGFMNLNHKLIESGFVFNSGKNPNDEEKNQNNKQAS